MDDDVVIGGLPVPSQLIAMIRAGKWVTRSDEILSEVFGERPVQPLFYGEGMLIRENRGWHADPDNAGPPQPLVEGNLGLLVERSLVIADLGPDMPIVLDFRLSFTSPRVLYPRGLAWVQIAASFEELVGRLYPQSAV
ncbi:hypothetical protein [Streptomyces sp. NPDC002845]